MHIVSIAVHYLDADVRARFPLPKDDIEAVFRSAGVLLSLTESSLVGIDPYLSSSGYTRQVRLLGNERMGNGHLFVTELTPPLFPFAAGELVDLSRRRAAAIFTSCDYLKREGYKGLLQTCVHEIGHMLNLTHPPGRPRPMRPSAMSSWSDRSVNIQNAWEAERDDAARRNRERKEGHDVPFSIPTRSIDCLPFSFDERRRLNGEAESTILPGGSPYRGEAHD